MTACAGALARVPDVRPSFHETIAHRVRWVGRDFLALLRSPIALLVMVIVMSPIGAGGAINSGSAVAPDWRTSPDTVALVTGVLSGAASVAGCVATGWICDRLGRWWAFFGSGAVMAAIAIGMAALPRTPWVYVSGVLLYALSTGGTYAAFSALLLHVTAAARPRPSTRRVVTRQFPHGLHDGVRRLDARSLRCRGDAEWGGGPWPRRIALGLAALGAINRLGSFIRASNRPCSRPRTRARRELKSPVTSVEHAGPGDLGTAAAS